MEAVEQTQQPSSRYPFSLSPRVFVGGVLLLLLATTTTASGDLIVNVRNQGGESYKQTIRANLTDETVTLEFGSHDGSNVKLVIDFKNEIQLIATTRLGDQDELDLPPSVFYEVQNQQELAQQQQPPEHEMGGGMRRDGRRKGYSQGMMRGGGGPGRKSAAAAAGVVAQQQELNLEPYRSYCFVTKFRQHEFIPVDAMVKLRQKNPWSLRTPERTEPPQNITFDVLIDPTESDWISPIIGKHCASDKANDFVTSTFAVRAEVSERAMNPENYLRAVRDLIVEDDKSCAVGGGGGVGVDMGTSQDAGGGGAAAAGAGMRTSPACVCTIPVCIGWYPCNLKYCRARSIPTANNTGTGDQQQQQQQQKPGPAGAGGGAAVAQQGPSSTSQQQQQQQQQNADNRTYRCGIHTCRICRNYSFGVRNIRECV